MGKSAIIITFGMSVIITFFILKLNANSKEGLNTTINMFEQTQARLIANSGVEIFLEKLKSDRTMLGKSFNGNSLFGGNYDINITGPDSSVVVTSTATFQNVSHTSIVNAKADRLPIFPAPGAMYVATDSVNNVRINGNITVSGYDHDINGVQLALGLPLPGIAVDNAQAENTIIGNISGAATIEGFGGTPSVHTVNNVVDWEQYALDVVSDPDIIINTQSDLGNYANLGTIAVPKTTFVNGDIHINSNLEGCGLLVVNGNLRINGNFTYRGIVIAYSDADITTQLNGNGKVYGGMIVAGNRVNLTIANGNFNCLYSKEALQAISALLKTTRFRILSWWE